MLPSSPECPNVWMQVTSFLQPQVLSAERATVLFHSEAMTVVQAGCSSSPHSRCFYRCHVSVEVSQKDLRIPRQNPSRIPPEGSKKAQVTSTCSRYLYLLCLKERRLILQGDSPNTCLAPFIMARCKRREVRPGGPPAALSSLLCVFDVFAALSVFFSLEIGSNLKVADPWVTSSPGVWLQWVEVTFSISIL